MTTKRKPVEFWVWWVDEGPWAGHFWACGVPPDGKPSKARLAKNAAESPGTRYVRMVEDTPELRAQRAELKRLRRVARAAKRYCEPHSGIWQPRFNALKEALALLGPKRRSKKS